jgi:hypothetical protein
MASARGQTTGFLCVGCVRRLASLCTSGRLTKLCSRTTLATMSRYYLWSIGCQMNDADATAVRRGLGEMGFSPASDPREADLVVLITCVVRQRAEDKVISRYAGGACGVAKRSYDFGGADQFRPTVPVAPVLVRSERLPGEAADPPNTHQLALSVLVSGPLAPSPPASCSLTRLYQASGGAVSLPVCVVPSPRQLQHLVWVVG